MTLREHLEGLTSRATRDTWGEPVAYRAAGSPSVSLVGVFDAAAERLEVVDGVEVATVAPALDLRLEDLDGATPADVDTAMIRGVWYRVTAVDLDGHGNARCWLVRA